MAFSEIEMKRIDSLVGETCRSKVPAHLRDQLRFEYKLEGQSVTVWEVRPRFDKPEEETWHGVAKFRYYKSRARWSLYWMRQDLKWHRYDPAEETHDLAKLVAIVEADEYGAFYG